MPGRVAGRAPASFLTPFNMATKRNKPRKAASAKPPVTDAPPSAPDASSGQETPPADTPEVHTETPPAPAAATSAPEQVSAGDLVGPLVAGMPEPTDSPLAADPINGGNSDPATPNQFGQVDTAGVVFDPAQHMADERGAPKTDARGRFYSKNVGRKKGDPRLRSPRPETAKPPEAGTDPVFDTDPVAPGTPSPSTAPTAPNAPDRFDLAADLYCKSGYGLATTAFSDDGWQPESAAEHEALRTAVAVYLRAKQSEDLPPGVILTLAISAYAGKRVSRPRTRERLLILWMRIQSLFKRGPKLPESETESESAE
jgi:hypothetical protein